MAAADLDGSTGPGFGQAAIFEDVVALDLDDVLDRHRLADVLAYNHRLTCIAPSTQTADGTCRFSGTFATGPSHRFTSAGGQFQEEFSGGTPFTGGAFTSNTDGGILTEDSLDPIGRPLDAIAGSPFSDGATGVGGAGSAGEDNDRGEMPHAGMFTVDRRDEIFVAGVAEASNIDDASLYSSWTFQWLLGVYDD